MSERAEQVDALASRIFDAAVSMHSDFAVAKDVQDIGLCVQMAADAALRSMLLAESIIGGRVEKATATEHAMAEAANPIAHSPLPIPSQEDRLRQLMRTWIGETLVATPGCELTMDEIGTKFDAAMDQYEVRVQRPCHQILEQELMSVFRRQGVQLEVGGHRVVRGVAWR